MRKFIIDLITLAVLVLWVWHPVANPGVGRKTLAITLAAVVSYNLMMYIWNYEIKKINEWWSK